MGLEELEFVDKSENTLHQVRQHF
uniref:Uncharacterized protein n=1 Tax=Anguilla anguilla TaxID=7936 RepID=A0A0E9P6K8_ANGAN